MAPQNSTLIHENTELASDLSRYSPILTIKEDGNDDDDDVHRRRKSISSSEDINILQVNKTIQFVFFFFFFCDVQKYNGIKES